jgi:exosome complex component RRP41
VRGKGQKAIHDAVLVNCQYSMATFSTGERKRRPRGDRKSQEMTMHLKQALTAAIRTELYPRSQIDIFLEVSMFAHKIISYSGMYNHTSFYVR